MINFPYSFSKEYDKEGGGGTEKREYYKKNKSFGRRPKSSKLRKKQCRSTIQKINSKIEKYILNIYTRVFE